MDLSYVEKNKKWFGGVALVVVAILAAVFGGIFNQPVTNAAPLNYLASFSAVGTWSATTVTPFNNLVTTGASHMNGTQSVFGGTVKYMNSTAVPSAMTDWNSATDGTGADYTALNDTGTANVVTLKGASSYYQTMLMEYFVPSTTYAVTNGDLNGNCTNASNAVNLTIYVWNFTSSAWQLINSTTTATQANFSLALAAVTDANGLKNGVSLYYMAIPNMTNVNCTFNFSRLNALSYTTSNYTLGLKNATTEGSLNCSIIGTSTAGAWQYDYIRIVTGANTNSSKEFGSVSAVVCNATPSGAMNLTSAGGVNIVNFTTSKAISADFVANGAASSAGYPPSTNLTSAAIDASYADADAGSRALLLSCVNATTAYLDYSDDGVFWVKDATAQCSSNTTSVLLTSNALSAPYYRLTLNQSFGASWNAQSPLLYVRARHTPR